MTPSEGLAMHLVTFDRLIKVGSSAWQFNMFKSSGKWLGMVSDGHYNYNSLAGV